MPEVIEASRTTGPDRLIIKVVARSVPHLDKVLEQLRRYGTPTTAVILSSRRQFLAPGMERE